MPSHLVYAVRASDVKTTIVSGRILMRDGNVLTVDGASAKAEAASHAVRIQDALAGN